MKALLWATVLTTLIAGCVCEDLGVCGVRVTPVDAEGQPVPVDPTLVLAVRTEGGREPCMAFEGDRAYCCGGYADGRYVIEREDTGQVVAEVDVGRANLCHVQTEHIEVQLP